MTRRVSVILLTGMGRAFSAGADLKEIADHFKDPANPAVSGETTSREFDGSSTRWPAYPRR
jgi:enoyl-CoA hydratase/carnithine racemase